MKKPVSTLFGRALLFASCLLASAAYGTNMVELKNIVDSVVVPVKESQGIPGMAVGIVIDGNQYLFNYGVASKESMQPITDNSLFEVGSISKTFTATLASLAQVRGKMAMTDKVSAHINALKASPFGKTTMLNLATHTTGGLPMQVPDQVSTDEQLLAYLKSWKPSYRQGSHRTYSNISIGLLGVIAAKSMQNDFASLMQEQIFPAFGMKATYVVVPVSKMADYAQGYNKTDAPVRMKPDVLSAEAYGVRTTASDLMQFIKANIGEMELAPEFSQALMNTHAGYFKAGAMTQGMIWELYPYPVNRAAVLEGSSNNMVFEATNVSAIKPPIKPGADMFIHKTGSTNGFGAYLAFIPKKKIGIVILANKNYPTTTRISMAQEIFAKLGQ